MGKTNKILLLGLGAAGVLLTSKENRNKAMGIVQKAKDRAMHLWGSANDIDPELLKKAGHPDPYDLEDVKMVGEGAQYSVEYYNKEEQQV